ncbi:SRPBCC domain-containing protein [Streptomyces luteireticuli]|uniref:SRPBCC domain-containing protein n=1 Tax=Streptomyces luteireticuli TaxID=173858 RepID=A0ABN0YFH1_9ACTN
MNDDHRPTGLTQDAGFQIGVSRTLPVPPAEVWRFLTSPEGLALWLGGGADIGTERGSSYTTADGTTGEVRGFREGARLRLTHRPSGAVAETTVQVTVTPRGEGAMLRFHQERLPDAAARAERREHWHAAMETVVNSLAPQRP